MGTLTSTLGTITKTLGTVSTLTNQISALAGIEDRSQRKAQAAQQNLAMKNLQQSQQLSEKQAATQAQLNRDKIALDAKTENQRKLNALKKSVARQNVQFASSGIGGGQTGSREAVLLGLSNETNDDLANQSQLDQLRYNTIDNDLYELQQSNILVRTQLAERQRLEREIRG